MALSWGLPFAGLLLCIAILSTASPRLWHRAMPLIVFAWCAALIAAEALLSGPMPAWAALFHSLVVEYLPLISLLLGLYVAGGGLLIEGAPGGTPAGNTGLLAIGLLLAGILGTTGASMVLIRPLLRANAHRRRRVHLVVFFILLVANAGGGSTPLGDPPLYIGFLHGVPFAWPLIHLAAALAIVAIPLLIVFYLLDRHLARTEPPHLAPHRLRIEGRINLLLVAALVAIVVAQGMLAKSLGGEGHATLFGQPVPPLRLAAAAACLLVTLLSLLTTRRSVRERNRFRWAPMVEVAILFAGLFVTIAPVLAMLRLGAHGPLASVLALTTDAAGAPRPRIIFWMTGLMSGFLDNAPTYLVFFDEAGGNPAQLTGPLHTSLAAISAGAVLFGGLSYIGNAPNLMVRAIAEHQAVRMPGFFTYVAIAAALLAPGFIAITLLLL